MKRDFYVYILSNKKGTLYIGVTNDLERRIYEHKNKLTPGFSSKYDCHKLVYYEEYSNIWEAITREKQIKKWNRSKKENLINTLNSDWVDLSREWQI